jgi:hypothetical protein
MEEELPSSISKRKFLKIVRPADKANESSTLSRQEVESLMNSKEAFIDIFGL